MGPRRCSGFEDGEGVGVVECCFNPWQARERAQAKFAGKCTWCSPVRMTTVCADTRLRKLAGSALANFKRLDEDVYELAVSRVLASGHDFADALV